MFLSLISPKVIGNVFFVSGIGLLKSTLIISNDLKASLLLKNSRKQEIYFIWSIMQSLCKLNNHCFFSYFGSKTLKIRILSKSAMWLDTLTTKIEYSTITNHITP